ncbi:non-canonical purine NTP pyrophosphatase, RdgB/HAM1 family [bacterium K02(2017)]|nr:non-canonical purine NTP pyrophosphatase, RdgB/HAM1 family [bacterium K02(2017)]
MKTLYVASGNAHKIQEIQAILKELVFDIKGLDTIKGYQAPEETGSSFIENARIKADSLKLFLQKTPPNNFDASTTYIIADDSGLECDDLGGEPGIRSARYAGENATDAQNNQKLIDEYNQNTHLSRGAHFTCALALITPDGIVHEIIEKCNGHITLAAKGDHGFGYDPHFYLEELGKSMAELSQAEKNKISHRGKALRKLMDVLT